MNQFKRFLADIIMGTRPKQSVAPADVVAAMIPGGIEAQEAAGQAALVSAQMLPKTMANCTRAQLEEIGIRFGGDVDDLFVTVQLPDGWKLQATEHPMWSDLLDAQGRKRAEVFYKAAYYDRRADIGLCRRYSIDMHGPCDSDGHPVKYGEHTHKQTAVKDGETVLHVAGIRESSDYDTGYEHEAQAHAWLDANYPDWQDRMAYWD